MGDVVLKALEHLSAVTALIFSRRLLGLHQLFDGARGEIPCIHAYIDDPADARPFLMDMATKQLSIRGDRMMLKHPVVPFEFLVHFVEADLKHLTRIPIMIAAYKYLLPTVELPKDRWSIRGLPHREIAQMVDRIPRAYHGIPSSNQFSVHLLDRRERSRAIFDDIGVIEMRIAREKSLRIHAPMDASAVQALLC